MTAVNLWTCAEHAQAYLDKRPSLPHREAGLAALMEWVPAGTGRVLDLGTGDGYLLAQVLDRFPESKGVGLDFSATMLEASWARFGDDSRVRLVEHDLSRPLPEMGSFDLVVSGFAIHHLDDERKRALYGEVLAVLEPGGAFCNLEHVASPTPELHRDFLVAVGMDPDDDDPSNQLLDVESQLRWLRELGFVEVDCHWKWREMALLAGRRRAG